MKNILLVAKNQFEELFKDKGAILILVIGALLYALIYAVPYSSELIKDVKIAVVDYDNSELSRTFTRNLDATDYLEVFEKLPDVNSAQVEFFKNNIKSYVVIPADFERDLKRGKKVSISLFTDSAYLLIYKAVANGVIPTAGELSAKIEINKLMLNGALKKEAISSTLPFKTVSIPLFNPSGGYESYLFPVVLIMILQQTLFVGIGLLDGSKKEKMRKKGDFNSASSCPATIIIGKTIAFSSIYLSHSIVYFFIFPTLFGYNMCYQPLALFALLIPYLFAVCFLAQTFVYFFNEREGSLLTLTITSLPIAFLAGFLWPKESLPLWISFLSNLLPSTAAVNGIIRINQMGAGFLQVLPDFLTLIALCILYFTIAFFVVKNINE